MGTSVVFPAHSCRKGQGRGCFPFILEIGDVKRTSKAMAAPGSNEADIGKRGRRHISFAGKAEDVIGGLSLIEPHSPDLHAGLEGVTSMGPDDVVDQAVRGSNLDVRRIVIQADEITCTY